MNSHNEKFDLGILDYSSIPYCVVELLLDDNKPVDWIYRYCNKAFADIKALQLDAMLNKSCLNLFPKADEMWLKAYYRAAYDNTPVEMNVVIDNRTYHAAIMPVGKTGFCSCMIYSAVSSDSTKNDSIKSKQIQKEQVERENLVLNKLLPDYVSLYHMELNSGKYDILRLSDITNAIKLYEDKTRTFRNFDEYALAYADSFIPKNERAEFLDWFSCKNLKKRLKKNDKITYHYHSVSNKGKDTYYEAYAVKGHIDDKGFNIFLGFRNIDSILYREKAIQKQLEEALAQAELSNEIISSIAKSYQYISRIDIEADHFEEISNRGEINANLVASGTVSQNNKLVCEQSVDEEFRQAYMKFTDISTLAARMKNEETIALDYQMKDGSWHKLRFIEKKRDSKGNLTHVICAVRSISDTKMKEQNLMYQINEAKKDAAFKTRFLSNMSHDIKTPINGIMGMIEIADRYPDDKDMQAKCKAKILESAKYLVSLVDGILAMSKLEAGDVNVQYMNFDLTEVLSRANTDKQIIAEAKNIEYIVDWNKSDIQHTFLYGNPVYVQRLLTIIADNAVKFTNPGGTIHVWCKEKYSDSENVVYEFGCSDSGIGMSEEFVNHAFDMFTQENETSRTRYEGTGLGLAIAKKLADRLNGTIKIKSQKQKGTTVIINIPFKTGNEVNIKEPVRYDTISVKGLNALVVEDNDINMEIVKFMLENNGINVSCAADGQEAVNKFIKSTPGYYDVIFMDIMMPHMNGWDATRKIRTLQRPDSESIPIIAMSANSFAEDIINSRISGMNSHISKPLSEDKLVKVLKECMVNSASYTLTPIS